MKKTMSLILVMLGSGFIGGTISNHLATASQLSQSKQIETQEIRLLDRNGNVRGYLGVNELGVGIVLHNNNGKDAVTMLVNDLTGVSILTIHNRAILTVNEAGPSLTFRDDEGRLRTAIGAVKFRNLASGICPESSIILYDENRNLLFKAP